MAKNQINSDPKSLLIKCCWGGLRTDCSSKNVRPYWSVFMWNCCPHRYNRWCLIALTNSINSFSKVGSPRWLWAKGRLKKATGSLAVVTLHQCGDQSITFNSKSLCKVWKCQLWSSHHSILESQRLVYSSKYPILCVSVSGNVIDWE